MSVATTVTSKIRNRERVLGYWVMLDSPPSTERIARVGYDYVCVDGQHGMLGYTGILNALTAIDAGGVSAGLVRVQANDITPIGRALDAGAAGVIIPLVDTAADAARAVHSARYPPAGGRSFGPLRSSLRIGPNPADANSTTVVLAMIETPAGLANVAEICATPGLDGIYVGPSDLCLAVGGAYPGDPAVSEEFEAALVTICAAAESAGVAAGIHCVTGEIAAAHLADGYTFATVASDITHLEAVAAAHLRSANGG